VDPGWNRYDNFSTIDGKLTGLTEAMLWTSKAIGNERKRRFSVETVTLVGSLERTVKGKRRQWNERRYGR
jgi:hypothetical protein